LAAGCFGFYEPVDFLAQVGFLTPKIFRELGGCGTLVLRSSAKPSNILAVPRLSLRDLGIPALTKAALAKTSICSNNRQVHSR
jgi:hypothetical protein